MNKLDDLWLDEVANLGCVVCRREFNIYSPALIHHIRTWNGHRIDRDHRFVLPLCYPHHDKKINGVSFHADSKLWIKKFGTQEELLRTVHKQLMDAWEKHLCPSKADRIIQFKPFLEVLDVYRSA